MRRIKVQIDRCVYSTFWSKRDLTNFCIFSKQLTKGCGSLNFSQPWRRRTNTCIAHRNGREHGGGAAMQSAGIRLRRGRGDNNTYYCTQSNIRIVICCG